MRNIEREKKRYNYKKFRFKTNKLSIVKRIIGKPLNRLFGKKTRLEIVIFSREHKEKKIYKIDSNIVRYLNKCKGQSNAVFPQRKPVGNRLRHEKKNS